TTYSGASVPRKTPPQARSMGRRGVGEVSAPAERERGSEAGADGFQALVGGTCAGQIAFHLAELLAFGLGPPDGPGDKQNTENTDDAVEPPLVVIGDNPGDGQQRHHVHDLDERVERRAGRVLEGVADGVASDGRLVPLGALTGGLGTGLVLDQL